MDYLLSNVVLEHTYIHTYIFINPRSHVTIQDEDHLVGTFFGEVKEKSFAAQTQEEKKSKREKHPAGPLVMCEFRPFCHLLAI